MTQTTSTPSKPFGKLFLVATPIGNMKDITLRALEVLEFVDIVAAEDTRRSRVLLQHFGLSKPLLSLHAHNEDSRLSQVLEKLREGQNIALISDAGTPLISDPGFSLVQKIRQEKMSVIPVPGSCALIAALSASGLPCDHFFFAGFLPAQNAPRKKALKQYIDSTYTIIFYEAPHRILALFQDMLAIYGAERQMAFAKEITKVFEHFFLGTIQEAIDWLTTEPEHQKGEFVVMLAGKPAVSIDNAEVCHSLTTETILKKLLKSLPLKQAVQVAMELTGEKKNKVYALALELN